MDHERFKELANDYKRWVIYSSHNMSVGDDLFSNIQRANHEVISLQKKMEYDSQHFHNSIGHWGALANARILFYGLAIENAFKARLIFDGKVYSDGEKFVGLRSDHNIEAMANQLGVSSPKSNPNFLKYVTFQTQSLSKYPIAKSLKKQKEFTGVIVGAMKRDGVLTEEIILRMLKEDELIRIFLQNKFTIS
ncbi:MAG: hypothetical protein RLN88_08440 [Ekhidna sp.]|uniref:hypothetical protein n=1 Tax=Ekhidna sp. TaxID=2608089 RepID=UPI0032F054FF